MTTENVRMRLSTLSSIVCSRGVPIGDVVNSIVEVDGEFVSISITSPVINLLVGLSGEATGECIRETALKVAGGLRRRSRQHKGLGDMIAATLDSFGITKERVQALASKVGIKDCGCGKRQEIANELGAKYLGIGQKPS